MASLNLHWANTSLGSDEDALSMSLNWTWYECNILVGAHEVDTLSLVWHYTNTQLLWLCSAEILHTVQWYLSAISFPTVTYEQHSRIWTSQSTQELSEPRVIECCVIDEKLSGRSTFVEHRLVLSDYVCCVLLQQRLPDPKPRNATIHYYQKQLPLLCVCLYIVYSTACPSFCHRTWAGSSDELASQLQIADLTTTDHWPHNFFRDWRVDSSHKIQSLLHSGMPTTSMNSNHFVWTQVFLGHSTHKLYRLCILFHGVGLSL